MTKKISTNHSKEAPEFLNAVPNRLLDRASLCARQRKVPIELPLLVGLAAVSASIGKGLVVSSGPERHTRGNLYLLIGVSSGIGKSEVFKDLLLPILDFENSLADWWQLESSPRARAGEEMLKARITELRKLSRQYPRLGLRVFKEMQSNERKRDICRAYLNSPCLLADDATPESIAQLMERSKESIAMVSPDARYLLKRLSRTDSKEENFMLKSFSGDLSLTNRVSRTSTRLKSPCLTALLLTQPDAYHRFIEKGHLNRSGILPRFLHSVITPESADCSKIDLRRAPTIRSNYSQMLRDNIEAYRFESEPAIVEASSDANNHISRIEEETRRTALNDEGIDSEVRRRKAEMIWRVALCLHASRHGKSSELEPLPLQTAKCASQIVSRYTNCDH